MMDSIDRQAVIDALKICDCNEDDRPCKKCPNKDEFYGGSWYDVEGDCWIQLMHKAAELLSESQWIPIHTNGCFSVSDPMPKERTVYLVTYETPTGRRYVRTLECSYSGITPPHIDWSKKIKGTVIAWMPLPEPFQEEKK